ncbi:MAG: DUF1361 domain-containing protein [Ferruginibacter sp.]|nr:DUF1361 domain-containing protein [Cytophagales bacterium]
MPSTRPSSLNRSLEVIFLLLAMSLVCCAMVTFRIWYTGHGTYRFLVWNLFLAWIPVVAAYFLQRVFAKNPSNWPRLLALGLVWLLFLPNSPYLLTDFVHLEDRSMSGHDIHLLYDAALIFAFALTGLLNGFVSLYWVHRALNRVLHQRLGWLLVVGILALTGYGVYLGRVLRWNSWDVVTNPRSLAKDVLLGITHSTALSLTTLFAGFLLFGYLTLYGFLSIGDSRRHD